MAGASSSPRNAARQHPGLPTLHSCQAFCSTGTHGQPWLPRPLHVSKHPTAQLTATPSANPGPASSDSADLPPDQHVAADTKAPPGSDPQAAAHQQAQEQAPHAKEAERSALANEEVVYFIFQLDLDTQLQRALNGEQFAVAQEVRAKRLRVDAAVAAMAERKARNVGTEAASAALTPEDFATEGLRLRTAMARAVEAEDYAEAARCRDLLNALDSKAKQAQTLAAEFTGRAGAQAPLFRLGQRILHARHGYRGVIVGWDAQCCESEEWVAANGGPDLCAAQPFYHVLVDQRDWQYSSFQPPVAYVGQDFCWAPELGVPPPPNASVPLVPPPSAAPGLTVSASAVAAAASGGGISLSAFTRGGSKQPSPSLPPSPGARPLAGGADAGGSAAQGSGEVPPGTGAAEGERSSWVELFGPEPLAHPFVYILFLGQDGKGDYLPCRQLRDKYSVLRRDVHPPKRGPTGNDS